MKPRYELYGLRIGDRVRYIGSDTRSARSVFLNRIGTVDKIIPPMGQFQVAFDDREVAYVSVSCHRYELSLLINEERDDTEFEGRLITVKTMTIGQLCSYLNRYHGLTEGKDFAVTERDRTREVFLSNDAYCRLIDHLTTLDEVGQIVSDTDYESFDERFDQTLINTLELGVTPEGAVFSRFKTAGWVFKTHLTPWTIQKTFLRDHGFNLERIPFFAPLSHE